MLALLLCPGWAEGRASFWEMGSRVRWDQRRAGSRVCSACRATAMAPNPGRCFRGHLPTRPLGEPLPSPASRSSCGPGSGVSEPGSGVSEPCSTISWAPCLPQGSAALCGGVCLASSRQPGALRRGCEGLLCSPAGRPQGPAGRCCCAGGSVLVGAGNWH